MKKNMKIISLGVKESSGWSRSIAIEHKGKKYKGTIEYSDNAGFVVDVGNSEIENKIYELISEDCFQVTKDEVLIEGTN